MEENFLTAQALPGIEEPLFEPTYLNLGYIYNTILDAIIYLLRLLWDFVFIFAAPQDPLLRNIFWVISLGLLVAIIYVLWRYSELRRDEREEYDDILESTLKEVSQTDRNKGWTQILNGLDSLNESDWRVAIMEADNMLEVMLEKMGYVGESMAEKLKAVEPSDFLTLQKAWDAHKVRNQIAHSEAGFVLTKREATRVIDLYREVFEEFSYI